MIGRKTDISINYQGKSASSELKNFIENLTYTDSENQSDALSIVLTNIDMRFLNEWMPQMEDKLSLRLGYESRNFDCGDFIVDDLSYSGRPLVCNLKALSAPINENFKASELTKTWEGVSLKQIAQEIAGKASLGLSFDVEDVNINSIEQAGKTDASFLKEILETYDYSLKIYANKLLVFSSEKLSKKASVKTFNEMDFSSWSYNATIGGSYTGVELKYTDPKTKKTFSAKLGSDKRLLKLNEKCESDEEAKRIAVSRFNKANENISTLSVELVKPVFLSSTQVVEVKGLGNIDGNYYIKEVKHNISSGYRMSLEMRKVEKGLEESTVKESSSDTSRQGSPEKYIVKKGDNLWSIAKKKYGNGAKYREIYEANKEVIENEARKRRGKSSDNGHYIYPGTVLNL